MHIFWSRKFLSCRVSFRWKLLDTYQNEKFTEISRKRVSKQKMSKHTFYKQKYHISLILDDNALNLCLLKLHFINLILYLWNLHLMHLLYVRLHVFNAFALCVGVYLMHKRIIYIIFACTWHKACTFNTTACTTYTCFTSHVHSVKLYVDVHM